MSEPSQPPPAQPFGHGPGVPATPPYQGQPPAPPGPPSGPPRYFYPAPPPPPSGSGGTTLLGCGLALSVFLNMVAIFLIVLFCMMGVAIRSAIPDGESTEPVPEVHYSGKKESHNKIAIVSLEGIILEGTLSFVHRQIDQAVRDREVKAVVLRINSPGGSITASADLHHRLTKLANGDPDKKSDPKPLIVSMAGLAASGGYYVAMPGKSVLAEETTLTGSIGVFASFPDVSGLAKKYEFGMTTIKQGEIKDSGSPFKEMTPKERLVWQDMVDHAYDQFLAVVAEGRKDKVSKTQLLQALTIEPVDAGPKQPNKEPVKPYQRYLADGGIWTSNKALQYKLIDQIGNLDDAVQVARDAAELGKDYKAIRYEKAKTLSDLLRGSHTMVPGSVLEPGRLRAALTPRLWYLAPGSELAGILGAAEAE
jgi:protease-4